MNGRGLKELFDNMNEEYFNNELFLDIPSDGNPLNILVSIGLRYKDKVYCLLKVHDSIAHQHAEAFIAELTARLKVDLPDIKKKIKNEIKK